MREDREEGVTDSCRKAALLPELIYQEIESWPGSFLDDDNTVFIEIAEPWLSL